MRTTKSETAKRAAERDAIRKSWTDAGITMGHAPRENMQLLEFKSEAHMEIYFKRLTERLRGEKEVVRYSDKSLVIIS